MTTRTISILALVSAAAGCSSIRVNTNYDPAVDFSTVTSFALADRPMSAAGDARLRRNEFIERDVARAVISGMENRGYRHDRDDPDVRVSFFLSVDQKLDVDTWNSYYGNRRRGVIVQNSSVRRWDEGTLIVDIVSSTDSILIWRGTARSDISGINTPEERAERINTAVTKILSEFPPQR